jgi:DNA-directed RNA polymerase specialized sigma24 family protein
MRGERADAELLSSGVASDFGCFYDRHVRAVTAFVGSWIGQPDVVFDLVAETFARALEHRAQYEPSKGPTVAWLLGIARNLMIDCARRGQVESESRVRLGMGRVELEIGDESQAACDDARRGRPTLWFSEVGDPARRPAQLVNDGLLASRRAHRANATRLAEPNDCRAR